MDDYLYVIIFAAFVILQIVAWILFAVKISKEVKKKDMAEMIEERESKIFRLYSNLEELMDAFEEYVDEVRTEIDRDHKELIEISRQAADIFAKAMQITSTYSQRGEEPMIPDTYENPAAQQNREQAKTSAKSGGRAAEDKLKALISTPARQNKAPQFTGNPAAVTPEPQQFSTLSQKDRDAVRKFATKAQKVRYLITCGLTEAEIARELDIGKGEVHLIAELEK